MCAAFFVTLVTSAAAPPAAAIASLPKPGANYAAIVVDHESGKVLFNEAGLARRQPASLTKMMTLYLAFEALEDGRLDLNQQLPVSSHAASMEPSKLGVPAGGQIQVQQAVLAIITKSANDIAVVVAEALGGSESGFAEQMNRKARELGMTDTNFRNASGLPASMHYSTARDLVILSRALVSRYPGPYRWFATERFQYGNLAYPNMNPFIRTYAGADGIKTGYTRAAGHCLSGSAVRSGRRVFVVVLGGPSMAWTRKQVTALTNIAFGVSDRKFADLLIKIRPPAASELVKASSPTAAPDNAVTAAKTTEIRTATPSKVVPIPANARSKPKPIAKPTAVRKPASATPPPTRGQGSRTSTTGPTKTAAVAAPLAHAAGVPSLRGFQADQIRLPANNAPVEMARQGPRPAAGQWNIRVGEFGDMAAARRRAEHVLQLLPASLAGARLRLESQNNSIDIKLVSLTERDARNICGALQQSRMPCIVVPPGREVFITRR